MKQSFLIIITLSFLSNPFFLIGQIANKESYLESIRIELQKKWPQNQTINLVFHGHSVPAGYFKTPTVNTLAAYPYQLLKRIKTDYPYAVINVINTSIGGENSKNGSLRFESEVLKHDPDVLFIDYALNDRDLGIENAERYWREMIQKAIDKDIKIILLTPSADQREDILNSESKLNKHANMIRELAKEYQIGLIDSYDIFKSQVKKGLQISKLMSQVNHPNEQGHLLITSALYDYFKE
ncbi:SGNH/GDSL hydrolase family protein [Membranihabitans maritimus]|uniref:SGNH/GDSL hydrolase family protein n=1 Tax=Membranihabitans maritimus TaxID=2904244 RepID=UPI001F25EC4B|nr:SGNH/GDSL hydrolase family protein [Membranihabitans maritimus]